MANLDFTGVDPSDYINATLIRNDIAFRAHPNGMWYRYVEPVTGGSSAWADITGKPAAVTALTGTNTGDETLATIKTKLGISTLSGSNTGDQDISGLLSISTAASTYAPISTTVTLAGNQTITGIKNFNETPVFSAGATVTGDLDCSGSLYGGGAFITNISASNITAGTLAAARIADSSLPLGKLSGMGTGVSTALAVNTGSTGAVALQGGAISATTVTASGLLTANGKAYFGDGVAANSFQIVSGTSANFITTAAASIRTNSSSLIHNGAASGFVYFNRDVSGVTTIWNNTSSNILMQLYPSGGLYVGATPTDPGANNLRVQGNLTASGTVTASNFKRGTGSPESVVTGSTGDLYTRTDGGAGTTLYVKESGTGNTGWVAK